MSGPILAASARATTGDFKGDPDGRAGVIFVLDFGFGESGVVVDAPVDGLTAAIDVTLFHEVGEGFRR